MNQKEIREDVANHLEEIENRRKAIEYLQSKCLCPDTHEEIIDSLNEDVCDDCGKVANPLVLGRVQT